MSEKPPMFMAINNITIRVNKSSNVNYYYLEFMKPPQYHHESEMKIEDAQHFCMYLSGETIKEFADLLYTQLSLKYVEETK